MKTLYKILTVFVAVCFFAACEQAIDKNSGTTDPAIDPSKIPTGIVTGNILDNMGTSAIFSGSVSGDGGSLLIGNGIIVCTDNTFTQRSPGVFVGTSPDSAVAGEFNARVSGLKKSTLYYYRAFSANANGIAYGDVKSFTTSAVIFSPYSTKFDPSKESDIADWKFDKYTGFAESEDDLIWFNEDVGTTCVSCYIEEEALTVVSPLIRIAKATDLLKFNFYTGGYGHPETKIKVYITEDLNNYGAPVKDWTFELINASTSIPMQPYFNKSIYVVIVVEAGDFIFWNFSIAP